MIHVDLNPESGIAVVHPVKMTGLTENDFTRLTALVDQYLKDHKALRGLVIVAESFPGWEDFDAFVSHMTFVRDHHKKIQKVALVSDSPVLSAAPHLVDHFLRAKVRHFGPGELEAAKTWAGTEDPRAGRFVVLEDYPDDVAAFRAEGLITADDYEEVLIPVIEAKIDAVKKVKLLYWCGEDFEGFSAGAMWDDARFGLAHLGSFAKVAVVTDMDWLRKSVKFFAPLIPAPVQLFANAQIEDAKRWICEG